MLAKEFRYTVEFFEDDNYEKRESVVDFKDINKELFQIFGKKRLLPVIINKELKKIAFEKDDRIDFEEYISSGFNYEWVYYIGDTFSIGVFKDENNNLKLDRVENRSECENSGWMLLATVTFEILAVE